MPTIFPDVSRWQDAVADDSYTRHWFSYRCCDGTYIDPHFAANHSWARKATRDGKLEGFTVYCVFRPGVDVLAVLKAQMPKPPARMVVMVDVESWGGQITGNHSGEIAALCQRIADWLGSRDRVWAYGNQGDLAALFPNRPAWLRLVVAGYGTQQPNVANLIGWQYTDGSGRYALPAGLPDATPPFGRCDHNIVPAFTPKELAALCFGPSAPTGDHGKPPKVPDDPHHGKPHKPKAHHYRWRVGHLLERIAKLRARLTHRRNRR